MDDFVEFITEYRKRLEKVSVRAMLQRVKEIDKDLLDAGICWMVTDNICCLLAENPDEPVLVLDPETWEEILERTQSESACDCGTRSREE